ncbi:MAG: J domain-containing protein [Sphingobium sp.]|nr:J domain-containing protein [Sphingobium sp.]
MSRFRAADGEPRRHTRFHGRVESSTRACASPGCAARGEFRAPPEEKRGADGPPAWRWFCLDHIREFNQGYNFFKGMSSEEIDEAQRPYAGWGTETRAFSSNAQAGTMPPRWGDFSDPLDAIGAGFKAKMAERAAERGQRADGKPLSHEDRSALRTMELSFDADRKALRSRYTELVRRYHPDHNGGDRTHEKALQQVVEAYAHLRKAPAFV